MILLVCLLNCCVCVVFRGLVWLYRFGCLVLVGGFWWILGTCLCLWVFSWVMSGFYCLMGSGVSYCGLLFVLDSLDGFVTNSVVHLIVYFCVYSNYIVDYDLLLFFNYLFDLSFTVFGCMLINAWNNVVCYGLRVLLRLRFCVCIWVFVLVLYDLVYRLFDGLTIAFGDLVFACMFVCLWLIICVV